MTIWVHRRGAGASAEKWHLFEPMTPGDARVGACGTTFAATDTLDRLELANPADGDRCPDCQMAYRRELHGGSYPN